jgi:RNA polymerase sigma-70 factor (ECF subfamily)
VLGFLRARGTPDPEDVLGATFLEVARSIDSFEGDRSGFRAWVFTVARSRRVDAARRAERRPETVAAPDALPDDEQPGVDPAVLADSGDITSRLEALTDDQRDVVAMRVFGGFSCPEIAELTGRSTGAVEQLYHRALTQLRKRAGEGGGPSPRRRR